MRVEHRPLSKLFAIEPLSHQVAEFRDSHTARVDQIHVQSRYAKTLVFSSTSDDLSVRVDRFSHPLQHHILLRRQQVRRLVQQRETFDEILIRLSQTVVPFEHSMKRLQPQLSHFFVTLVPKRRRMRKHAVIRPLRTPARHAVHVDDDARPRLSVNNSEHVRQRHLIHRHERSIVIHRIGDHSRRLSFRTQKRRPRHRYPQRLESNLSKPHQVLLGQPTRPIRVHNLHRPRVAVPFRQLRD